MEPVEMLSCLESSLTLLDDAGYYFSPNVDSNHILQLQNFKARTDDVLLVTYPKSGTHWMWEILSMLVHRSQDLMRDPLLHTEYVPMDILDSVPSPRVLCSHLAFPRIPLDFLRKRSKIVVCIRNPRDVAVSYFEFVSKLNIWNFNESWDQFFDLFIEGKVAYNSWFDHVDTWLKVARRRKQSVHVVFYEDLHKNFTREIQKLSEFLSVDLTSDLLANVQAATQFENMKINKADLTLGLTKNGGTAIYRKGEVGDWENYFTEDQLERLDRELAVWGLDQESRIQYHSLQEPTSHSNSCNHSSSSGGNSCSSSSSDEAE